MATIATGATLGAVNSQRRSSNQDLHVIGGNMYIAVVETADGDPHIYKSTDQGATWAVQDATNAPDGDNANTLRHTINTAVHGTTIYVLYRDGATTNLFVQAFNTATDTWGASLGAATADASSQQNAHIVARSDGDLIVSYISSTDDADVLYARWEGVSWTSDVAVQSLSTTNISSNIELITDSTDRTYFVYIDSQNGDIMYRSLNSANTLGTATDIDTSSSGQPITDATMAANYQIYDVGGVDTITVAFNNSTDDIDAYVVTLESDSGSGNIAAEEANIHTGTDLGENIMATFRHNGTRYIFWWDFDDQDIRYISNSGSGWGTAASNQTVYKTLGGPAHLGFVGSILGGVYAVWSDNGTVSGEWFIAPPASLTVAAATASAAGEAVTFDAAAKLTVTEATAPAAGQAVTLKGQGALAVTAAAAPAQAEAVTLDAASLFTVAAASAPAAAGNVALTGQARLAVTEATAPAAAGNVTFTAAALFTIDDAEAAAAAGNVNLAAAAAASLDVTPATASAVADGALTGQGRLPVTAADAPAQGEGVTFLAAALFTIDDAEAPAAGGNVNLTAGAAASLTVSPAAADAQGEAVTLDAAAVMAIDAAAAAAQGEAVTLDVAARLIVDAATASAAGQNVTLHGQGVLGVTETFASAEGENVILFGGTSIPGTLAVAPATSAAAGEGVTLDAAAVFTAGTATAPAQGENVTLDAAAVLAVSAANAAAAGETVGLIGQAVITITPASAPAAADGAFAAAAVMTIDSALANAAAGNVELVGAVPGDLYFRLITARVLTLHVEAEPVLLYKRSAEPVLTFAMKGDYDGSN